LANSRKKRAHLFQQWNQPVGHGQPVGPARHDRAAVKANVSIYSLDVRGLQAFPPGGEAQSASLHGQSAYSGAAVLNDLNGNAGSQETLATLSSDTGGKAFFDSNDFGGVFSQVQKDSSAYYVLGFTSNNPLKDGKFRRLKVQVNRADLKLDFRSGYYAGRDFEHLNRADREQQLETSWTRNCRGSTCPFTQERRISGRTTPTIILRCRW